jgi:hypothetical protein
MNPIVARAPGEFSAAEIGDFIALVQAGGEVAATGLHNRVTNTQCLAFLRSGQCLVGVAGLKHPEQSYRARIAKSAGFPISSGAVPFELGWVFILPSSRGSRLSLPLCQAVVAAAGASGVFATSRSDNTGMHITLGKLGFQRVGSEWHSKQSNGNLSLFVKPAV